MMLPALAQRVAAGRAPPGELEARVWGARLRRLAPSARVEVVREGAQRGQVTRLDLDRAEERYLLAASGDGTVGLYDLAEGDGNYGPPRRPPSLLRPMGRGEEEGAVAAPAPVRVRCLQATPRGNNTSTTSVGAGAAAAAAADGGGGIMGGMGGSLVPRGPPAASLLGHGHVVTTVQWYPLDTGLFVSGSSDGTVRVWDTNAFVTAGVFDLGAKVHAAAMSSAMRTHNLMAVGTDDRRVRLCDLKSGGSSHLLMGHSEAVLTAAWSPTQEHLLATGSRDATVRLWDVRRSGPTACLATLDQHADHHRRRAPGLMGGPTDLAKAHDGWVVSLAFTPNGSGLLSAGTDKRLRLWNAATGEHSLRNFRGTRNDRPLGWSITAIQPGAAATGAVLYPNGSSGDVNLYPLFGDSNSSGGSGSQGRPWHVLRGHLDAVSSAVYRRDAGQVVTGGADALVLVFDCSRHEAAEGRRLEEEQAEEERTAPGREQGAASMGADAWSSDEEEEEAVGGGAAGERPRRGEFVPPIIQQLIAGGGTLPNPPPQTQPQDNRSDDDDEGSGRGRRGGGGGSSGGRGGNGGRKRSRDRRGGSGRGSGSRGRGRGRIRR